MVLIIIYSIKQIDFPNMETELITNFIIYSFQIIVISYFIRQRGFLFIH